jgi:hypothetical protein
MNMVITEIRFPITLDIDRLATSTREAIQLAQQEAVRMQAPEVYPEHLLLGALRQGDGEVRKILRELGIDPHAISAGLSTVLASDGYHGPDDVNWPLSVDALACLNWASTFAMYIGSKQILPAHLLLSTMRHPSTHALMVLLLSTDALQTTPILTLTGADYTVFMDQLIYSRIREQVIVSFSTGAARRVLTAFERPTITYADIQGMDAAKAQLREVAAYLRHPVLYNRAEREYLFGTVLVGHPCTDRTLLVKATASEAAVALISLSMATLVAMLNALDSGAMTIEDFDLPPHEYNLLKGSTAGQVGRKVIHRSFEHVRAVPPRILFIDDLDALAEIRDPEVREQCWKQVLVEMDAFDYNPTVTVIATTKSIEGINREALYPTRFSRQVQIGDGFLADLMAQTRLCLSCKREGLAGWRYCIYCGTELTQFCAVCGSPSIQASGERFCYQCGNPRTARP